MNLERRKAPRLFFDTSNFDMSVIIPGDSIESLGLSYVKPWDISVEGASFVSNVACTLGSQIYILFYNKNIGDVLFLNCIISRVDQIRSIDVPEPRYKNVIAFVDLDEQTMQEIERRIL